MTATGTSRRQLLKQAVLVGVTATTSATVQARSKPQNSNELTCHEMSWRTFSMKDGKDSPASWAEFHANLEENVGEIARVGFVGFMPVLLPGKMPRAYLSRLIPLFLQCHRSMSRTAFMTERDFRKTLTTSGNSQRFPNESSGQELSYYSRLRVEKETRPTTNSNPKPNNLTASARAFVRWRSSPLITI